jgi:HEAT repeat protein
VQRISRERSQAKGDELLSRLLSGEAGGGELEIHLLHQLHEGYPVNKLRLLLRANDPKTVAAGMWIASELGSGARPLFSEIVGLLHDPSLQVRFFALDCLVTCAQPDDELAINLGLDLIDDPEPSVQWKALIFLATVSDAVLRPVLNAPTDKQSGVRTRGLQLVLNSATSHDIRAIVSGLADDDQAMRRYAAAAAARAVHYDAGPLRLAMGSKDPTIKQFALDMAARAGISGT